MCFVQIWEQTAIISLCSINWLVFITETERVYCAVRTECPFKQRNKWSAFCRRVLRFVSTRFRTPIEFEVLPVEREGLLCEELHVICAVYCYSCDKTDFLDNTVSDGRLLHCSYISEERTAASCSGWRCGLRGRWRGCEVELRSLWRKIWNIYGHITNIASPSLAIKHLPEPKSDTLKMVSVCYFETVE